jgi:hypothetical protein
MCMKTKDEAKEPSTQAQSLALTHPSAGSLLSPPSPISGVRWSDPNRTGNRTPQRRGPLLRLSWVYENRGNKPRMSMKTKNKVKKSESQGVEELRS